jgi:superfamily II DNA or RNA helicase
MSIILTNNRDRGEFIIRTHEGIIYGKQNAKRKGEATRGDGIVEGILPFSFINKDGTVQMTKTVMKGSFYIGDIKVNPGTGAWCATKVDANNIMIEWGYYIDLDYQITNLEDAINIAEQLVERGKSEHYIVGYLRTYIIDRDIRSEILSNHTLKETIRNKQVFPNVDEYKIGEIILVDGKKYILDESIELGEIYWRGMDIMPKKKLILKSTPKESKEEKYYGTNKDQEFENNIRSFQGIIDRDLNKSKRSNRKETIKECITNYDYINKQKQRTTSKSVCTDKDMTIDGNYIGPGGGPWCATEVDDTGLMREWGYCIKGEKGVEITKTEKTIWEKLCLAVRYEQWSNISKITKQLLLDGHTEKTIFNSLLEICDRTRIAPYYEQLKRFVRIEFIKLYQWSLVKSSKINIELLTLKQDLSSIVFNKLEYLELGSGADLHSNLISEDRLWLLNYYLIVERLIVESIISKTDNLNIDLLNRVKRTNDIGALNTILVDLESIIKKDIQQHIKDLDENKNVLIDLNTSKNADKKTTIDPNIIIVNYSALFGVIDIDKRNLYYAKLDITQPLAVQIAFYNKSFVEPKEFVSIQKEESKQVVPQKIKKISSDSKWDDENITYYLNYPEVEDPEFYTKLHRKKEFQTNKMGSWKDKNIDELCRVDTFDLSPQQQWVSNFFNIDTPYKGVLLYWGTGVGKTCASISIVGRHLDYYKKYNKRILVILGTSTMANYIKELYNFNKEKIEIKKGLIPGSLQCTGDRYYIPIESNDPESLKKRENRILKKIEQDYEFITYGSLKGIISKLLQKRGLKLELNDDQESPPKKEPTVQGEEVKVGNVTYKAIKTLKGLVWKEFIQLDLLKEERIRLAISDYFSNRLVVVDEIQNIRTAGEGGDQIAPKMLEKLVHYSHDLKLVLMSATPMFNNATEIVYILNLLLENDGRDKIKVNDIFDSKDNVINPSKLLEVSRGYISYVRGANPISFPRKLMPNESPISSIVELNTIYYPKPIHKMNGSPLDSEDRIKYNPLVKCDMSNYQETVFRKAVIGSDVDNEGALEDVANETFDINGKMISNIVYPLPPKQKFGKTDVTLLYGEKGFDRCFTELKSGKYEYNTENAIIPVNNLPILDVTNLPEFAPKFNKILQNILNTSTGIIFVYSEYKKGGSLPMALALEQNGFEQMVIEGKMGDIIVKNRLQSPLKRPSLPQKWKYVLLDGDMDPKKRAQIVQRCNSEDNKDGNIIKVVIGTRVAAEGIDFARMRQIHILNPWDNFSRIDQTIGRGIRNCSHKDLPVEERNVTVFLYSSHIADNSIETTDEKIHRRAERKDIQMKEVEFILRNGAIDCISNYTGNKYSIEDFGETIGDKDNTRECGYKECNTVYRCIDYSKVPIHMADANMDKDTYNIEYHANREIEKYKKIIKSMFSKAVTFKLKHIQTYCQMKLLDNFDESIFLVSLDKLIGNREKLYDKYSRIGRIVFKDGYYLFQPNDLDKTDILPEYYRSTPLTMKPIKTEIVVKEKDISTAYLQGWYKTVIATIDSTDDADKLAYYLDRVKDVVMRMIISEWFRETYNPDDVTSSERHDKITEYLENKDIIIMDTNDELPIAIQWTKEISYEYNTITNKLSVRLNNETLQKPMLIYNFDDYNLDTHVIGRLEQLSDGKEESPLNQMTCKIIDFSFVENKSNIKLDGKACMSYNRAPMSKLIKNLGLAESQVDKREDQCIQIELALRKYNREHKDDKVWWIESNKLYKLEKLL